jgi:hypothetical protein
MSLSNWLRRRTDASLLARRDAVTLIADFGENAYSIAQMRVAYHCDQLDRNCPPGHWGRVKAEIAYLIRLHAHDRLRAAQRRSAKADRWSS